MFKENESYYNNKVKKAFAILQERIEKQDREKRNATIEECAQAVETKDFGQYLVGKEVRYAITEALRGLKNENT